MPTRDVLGQILVRMLPLDLFIALTMSAAWLETIGIVDVGLSVTLAVSLCSARVVVWVVQLCWLLAPLRRWDRRPDPADGQALLAATLAVDSLPTRFTIRYCAGWLAYMLLVTALAWFVFPDMLTLGRTELLAIGVQSITAMVGPWMLAYPLIHRLVEPRRMQLVAELERRGVDRGRSPSSLVHVVTGIVIGLILAPSCWLIADRIVGEGKAARVHALIEARATALRAADELRDGASELGDDDRLALVRSLPSELEPSREATLVERVDIRRERVIVATGVSEGRWVVFEAPVELDGSRWLSLLGFGLAVFAWGVLAIRSTTRSLIAPLTLVRDRLRLATKVAEGPASLRMPVARSDELGELVVAFNELLDELEDIATAANAVAGGDLRVELAGEDHMRVVFRGMVARLAGMVAPIRAASAEVASAAAEIDATTHSQDLATRRQAAGIDEVESAMQRLATSTVAISGSANEVLANAEQTRARADVVVERTGALSESIARVRGLLEQIHEIAERSDLLALNGSLEATRAGEAGRGFGLVAAEMRRLAERVGTTLFDVRRSLAEVESSHAATTEATRDSRELAEHTTAAARRIFGVSEAQTGETELVSRAVQEVAVIIEQSQSAASQTRAAADGLREQARLLERLLERFEVGERGADGERAQGEGGP